jgi:hypothetical protein
MLLTSYKSRISQLMSWPVGLEDLHTVIGDVPQTADDFPVRFVSSPRGVNATEFQAALHRDLRHVVLEARFEKWDKRPGISNDEFTDPYLRGKWSVSIYPVARRRKAEARNALLNVLPTVKDWLVANRPPSWYYGRKCCRIIFDPAEATAQVDDVVEAM